MSDDPLSHFNDFLARKAVYVNRLITWMQAAALLAIAAATIVGIGTVIWGMITSRSANLPDLLLLFLFIAIIAMVKGCALGTREAPIRTPVRLDIVATCRGIMVDVENISPMLTLYASLAILALVCSLWILNKLKA